jgi:predicted ATPase
MARQPSGTVTLVFTDIEGSTNLLDTLGQDAYREALGEHRRVVREAFARFDGYEVDYEGDAFFYAFVSAEDAVSAVTDALRGLGDGPIRVRVGVHTGEPGLDPPKYVGMDVHMAARIMSAGHGGQVLLSKATVQHAGDDLVCTDLGEHRLKDLQGPIWLFQLGSDQFPPLKTISNTNLPRPASSFVGRERELAEVTSLVQNGARLLTLSGPGGSGKTRLAIEAAAELVQDFPNGVFWVGLAALRDPELVNETIGRTLGSKNGLAEHIAERELLLLLDNLEQVVQAAPDLVSLIEVCPHLRLLVTSRERLRVRGEVEYFVPPLADQEAAELFQARAGLTPDETVHELCRRLDDLPLAIELAAARAIVLTPQQILERLGARLDLLRGGRDAEARHQTLRATVEWSYELLLPDEQKLFARLSVFIGGCTLESAESVAGTDLDTLQSLVEKSLVRRGEGRFWMLETVREYAEERLEESGELNAVRERHADHYLDFVEQADPQLQGPERVRWLDLLEVERENIRSAFDWARGVDATEVELRLATALREFWSARGPITEGVRRLGEAAQRAGTQLPERRFEALRYAALNALHLGQYALAERLASDALDVARQLGNTSWEVSALIKLAHANAASGRAERGQALMEEAVSLARDAGDSETLARALLNLGAMAAEKGDFARGAEFSEQSLEAGGSALDAQVRAVALYNLAVSRARLGDADGRIQRPLREAITLAIELGDKHLTAECLETFAALETARDKARAATILGAAHAVLEELGAKADEEISTEVRAAGGEAYERAYLEGRGLSLEAAVARALRDTPRRHDRVGESVGERAG